jgi:hypothetical protein
MLLRQYSLFSIALLASQYDLKYWPMFISFCCFVILLFLSYELFSFLGEIMLGIQPMVSPLTHVRQVLFYWATSPALSCEFFAHVDISPFPAMCSANICRVFPFQLGLSKSKMFIILVKSTLSLFNFMRHTFCILLKKKVLPNPVHK